MFEAEWYLRAKTLSTSVFQITDHIQNTDHIPFGSGAMPPHPKRGGRERAKLAVHEKQTKAKDTALWLMWSAFAWRIWWSSYFELCIQSLRKHPTCSTCVMRLQREYFQSGISLQAWSIPKDKRIGNICCMRKQFAERGINVFLYISLKYTFMG